MPILINFENSTFDIIFESVDPISAPASYFLQFISLLYILHLVSGQILSATKVPRITFFCRPIFTFFPTSHKWTIFRQSQRGDSCPQAHIFPAPNKYIGTNIKLCCKNSKIQYISILSLCEKSHCSYF